MTHCPLTPVSAGRRLVSSVALAAALSLHAAAHAQVFETWQTNVGYGTLATTLGPATPTGAGVPIAQIEPVEGDKYYVALTSPELASTPARPAGLVPADGSTGAKAQYSGHATNIVGRYIYGNTFGLARGADAVTIFEAADWLGDKLHWDSMAAPISTYFDFRVQNHSWVSLPSSTLNNDQRALRHYDYAIDQFNITAIVGANNNESANPSEPQRRLLAFSYNALTVGRTDGKHARGATTSDYYAAAPLTVGGGMAPFIGGRRKPDIVAPGPFTSTTTAMVSSVAALLHDRANDNDAGLGLAANNETMKAILLAGATKDKNDAVVNALGQILVPATPLAGWGRTAAQPLDDVFGAGQVNVWNSYRILDGGRHAGGSASPGLAESYGWDYQDLKGSPTLSMKYNFVVPVGYEAKDLSIILSWNATVADPGSWTDTNSDVSLKNLNLALIASNGGVLPAGTYASDDAISYVSTSTVDNVEHLWIPGTLTAGTYTLTVSALNNQSVATAIDWDYGLAWRMNTRRLVNSADFDGDGFVDGSDLIVWQQNLGRLVNATHAQGDANGDGAVDAADLSLVNAQFTPAEIIAAARAAAAAVHAIPEPASLAMLAVGTAATGARRRRMARLQRRAALS